MTTTNGNTSIVGLAPIETFYNGCLYRSRLEARWAVFFDALEIPFQYEPEGYKLPKIPEPDDWMDCSVNGTTPEYVYYVPDFWLPHIKAFVEIKPECEEDGPTPDAWLKACRLKHFTGHRVYILCGRPGHSFSGEGIPGSPMNYRGYIPGDDGHGYIWCECPICGMVDIQFEGRTERIRCACKHHHSRMADTPKMMNAFSLATNYRFDPPSFQQAGNKTQGQAKFGSRPFRDGAFGKPRPFGYRPFGG